MTYTLKILIGLFLLITNIGCTFATPTCESIEVIKSAEDYNQLVCKGIKNLDDGDYKSAIKLFEKAQNMKIHSFPNFKLYSRLALAYHLDGNKEVAKENLDKADLALSVFTRILKCIETEKGFFIARESWSKEYKVKSPHHDEVMAKMCGAAYDYVYHKESLSEVLVEADLVKHYLEVKKKLGY